MKQYAEFLLTVYNFQRSMIHQEVMQDSRFKD